MLDILAAFGPVLLIVLLFVWALLQVCGFGLIRFAPPMEYLIDDLLCPRGFWSIDSTVRSWSADHELERFGRS